MPTIAHCINTMSLHHFIPVSCKPRNILKMALQRQLSFYPFLCVVLLFTIPRLKANPHSYNCSEEESGHDSQAYDPSYKDQIENGLIKMKTDDSSLKRLDKVGCRSTAVKVVSVDDYGAVGDGSTDDTEAFEKAWEEACSYEGAIFYVPKRTYLIKPIRFSGPCESSLTIQISGTVAASKNKAAYEADYEHWLMVEDVQNLLVDGGGTFDGNGKIWWETSCKVNKSFPCRDAPTALTFYECNNLVVKNIRVQNSQQIHVEIERCANVQISDLTIDSPGDSPNTDGIHLTETQNIQITNSVIAAGDDCISIVNGSQNVEMKGITCGPGHGISIGSLGEDNSRDYVVGVTLNGAKIFNTENGVRIKTYQGGSGNAKAIKFKNIEMTNVSNPIIIDQFYCDTEEPCQEQTSAVQVGNVWYENIKGTCATEVAILFICSKTYPCKDIVLEDIDLTRVGGKTATAVCSNVQVTELGLVSPSCSSTSADNINSLALDSFIGL